MKKTELRGFVEKKFAERRKEFFDKAEELLKASFSPLIDPLFPEAEKIKKDAIALKKKYEEFLSKYKMDTDWNKTIPLRNMYYMTNFKEHEESEIYINLRNLCLYPSSKRVGFIDSYKGGMFKEVYETVKPEFDEIMQTINKLNVLEGEVHAVINKHTAPKAYKVLTELGIDMTDFDPSDKAHLPAPTKFSVDVCLVNGGCK